MLPRWHILLGFVLAGIFWIVLPETYWFYIVIIFLSSILIDFDHYAVAVLNTKKLSLRKAFEFYRLFEIAEEKRRKRGIFRKGHFYILHTIEFHAFVLALGFIWPVFFYVLIGMLFHWVSDFIYMAIVNELYLKEFFLTNWIREKIAREN